MTEGEEEIVKIAWPPAVPAGELARLLGEGEVACLAEGSPQPYLRTACVHEPVPDREDEHVRLSRATPRQHCCNCRGEDQPEEFKKRSTVSTPVTTRVARRS